MKLNYRLIIIVIASILVLNSYVRAQNKSDSDSLDNKQQVGAIHKNQEPSTYNFGLLREAPPVSDIAGGLGNLGNWKGYCNDFIDAFQNYLASDHIEF